MRTELYSVGIHVGTPFFSGALDHNLTNPVSSRVHTQTQSIGGGSTGRAVGFELYYLITLINLTYNSKLE